MISDQESKMSIIAKTCAYYHQHEASSSNTRSKSEIHRLESVSRIIQYALEQGVVILDEPNIHVHLAGNDRQHQLETGHCGAGTVTGESGRYLLSERIYALLESLIKSAKHPVNQVNCCSEIKGIGMKIRNWPSAIPRCTFATNTNYAGEAQHLLQELREFGEGEFDSKGNPIRRRGNIRDLIRGTILTSYADICRQMLALLEKQPRVAAIEGPVYIFGDIHGNLNDLIHYGNRLWFEPGDRLQSLSYLFLGDYVDRGAYSIEVILYLFCLKLLMPEKVHLIRGNHEVRSVNSRYGFFEECTQKLGESSGRTFWHEVNNVFAWLPLCAVVENEMFCAHGGIPTSVLTLDDIARAPVPLVEPERDCAFAHEMMWNDPIDSMSSYNRNVALDLAAQGRDFIPNQARNTAFYYTESAVDKFMAENGIRCVIRAHECMPRGFRFHFERTDVITVFSCSRYCRQSNDSAAILVRKSPLCIQVVILLTAQQRSHEMLPGPNIAQE